MTIEFDTDEAVEPDEQTQREIAESENAELRAPAGMLERQRAFDREAERGSRA